MVMITFVCLEANKMTRCDLIGYIGAAWMVVFSFTLYPQIAVVGLTLLTVQSLANRLHNLTILNVISIAGFLSNIY